MTFSDLKAWRKARREQLLAARIAVDPKTIDAWRQCIDASLERSFPGLARRKVAFCWPIKNEYDARYLARTLRERGALTALPMVVAPKQPLAFREWHPGIELAKGPLDIPYPKDSAEVVPEAVLLPMNGWDAQGYRLGYGGGFFDRTLNALEPRPFTVGVSYTHGFLPFLRANAVDRPLDALLTEDGVMYERA
jgi:5-formyltetrahydrofolate cyclo-ligase